MLRNKWTWVLKLCVAAVFAVSIAIFVGPGGAVFFVAGGSGYAWWRRRAAERQTESKSLWPTLWDVGMSDPSRVFRAPLWLWAYAVMAIGEVVLSAILHGNHTLYSLALLGAMLISLLLLRGNGAAWCFAVLFGVYAIASYTVMHGPRWQGGYGLLQLGLLLAPASRRYVWQGEGFFSWLRRQSITWKSIRQLAAFVVVTLFLAVILGKVRSDHQSLAIDALWAVVFAFYGLALIVLLYLLALAGAGWIARRFQPEGAD